MEFLHRRRLGAIVASRDVPRWGTLDRRVLMLLPGMLYWALLQLVNLLAPLVFYITYLIDSLLGNIIAHNQHLTSKLICNRLLLPLFLFRFHGVGIDLVS
jgi:hypothetical protein